jgi:hypothetical protein
MEQGTFPIHPSDRKALPLAPPSIPYWIVDQHEAQAKRNHYQTVQRLKERQGCTWRELLAILRDLPNKELPDMSANSAMVEVVSIVGRADPAWMEIWRAVCTQRASKRAPSPAPFEIAKP